MTIFQLSGAIHGHALPTSSSPLALLLSTMLFVSSSIAQDASIPLSESTATTLSTTFISSAATSTLPTSVIPSSTTSTTFSTRTSEPSATGTAIPDDDDGTMRIYAYYFIIVAILIVSCGFTVAYFTKRNSERLAFFQSLQEAQAHEAEAWHGRRPEETAEQLEARARRRRRRRREEGLDENGFAPPPYDPGDKPPSISDGESWITAQPSSLELGNTFRDGENFELAHLPRITSNPPGYEVSPGSEASTIISRPTPAMTAPERANTR